MKRIWTAALIFIFAAGMMFLQPYAGSQARVAVASPNPAPVSAGAPIGSVTSGAWSDPANWDLGRIPDTGDAVTINRGHVVTYDILSDIVLGEIGIHGTLR